MSNTKTPVTTTIARNIRRWREELGLSQQQLADKVGVQRAQIKRLEAVEVESVDSKLLERLSRALGGAGLSPQQLAAKVEVQRKKAKQPSGKRASSAAGLAAGRKKTRPREAKDRVRGWLEKSGLLDMTLRELLG